MSGHSPIGTQLPPSASAPPVARGEDAPRRLLGHAVKYGSANYASAVLNAARGILIARILGPDSYGIWSVLTLVLVWTQFADLGLASAVNRQLPVARAEGDIQGARRMKSISLGLKLGSTGVVAVGILIAGLLAQDPVYKEGLFVVAGLALLQAVQQFGSSVLLAERQVREAARLAVTFSALNLGVTVAGALMAGLRGVWYGFGIALLMTAVLYLRALRVRPSLRVGRADLRQLAAIGAPLAVLLVISFNLVNVDQLVIVNTLGSRQLAFYTIALTLGGLLSIAPGSVASILGPPLIEKYHRGEEGLEAFAWEPVRLLRDLYCIPVLAAMLLVGPAVRWLLPQYEAGIGPALLYLPGAYLLGINLGASTYLLALGRQWANVPLALAAVVVSVAFELLFVRLGLGLSGVALGSTCGYLVYTALHLTVIRWHMRDSLPRAMLNAASMLLPATLWATVMLSGALLPWRVWIAVLGVFSLAYVAVVVAPRARGYVRLLRTAR